MHSRTHHFASNAPRESKVVDSAYANPTASDGAHSFHPTRSIPRSYIALFLGLAISGCAIDLATKHLVFQWRGMPRANNQWWIIPDYVGIETAINTGALFGMGQDRSSFFAAISVVAIIAIVYWLFIAGAASELPLVVSLGCVMGGIAGNLYDRLGLWGAYGVRDWILFRFGEFTWPNFNVADSLLVFGAGILVWHGIKSKPDSVQSE